MSNNKNIILDIDPEEKIQLKKEVNKHPPLVEVLSRVPDASWEEQLAMIAGYCMIMVDGVYNQKDLIGLYEILFGRLIERRTTIVTGSKASERLQ